jgi:hypothetical protein
MLTRQIVAFAALTVARGMRRWIFQLGGLGFTLEKVYKIFGRWGFGAIAVAALLPPPVPLVPILFVSGAMQ